jgi:hypothetical protein
MHPKGRKRADCLFWEGRNLVYLRQLTTVTGSFPASRWGVHDSHVTLSATGHDHFVYKLYTLFRHDLIQRVTGSILELVCADVKLKKALSCSGDIAVRTKVRKVHDRVHQRYYRGHLGALGRVLECP